MLSHKHENDQTPLPVDQGRGRLPEVASAVIKGVRRQRANRPIASVDVGIAKVSQIYRAFTGTCFNLYPDRIETPKGNHPLTPAVHAEVDSAGGFQRRRDRRELYLTIEGEGWSITQQCEPRRGEKVRGFAHAVNSAAKALSNAKSGEALAVSPDRQSSPMSDAAEAIRKLADLRDAGALTQAEFEAKKRELLERM